mgnify:FL=1
MKEGFPERYEPGELERTRKRIGPLTEDEIRRLRKRLGGEIGVEKTPPEIEAAYADLRKNDTPKDEEYFTKETVRESDEGQFVRYGSGRKEQPYGDRIRMNFLCARPEHGIKTKANAFFSVFSFFLPYRDLTAPAYILHMEEEFYTSVENLTVSVRALLAVYRRVFRYADTEETPQDNSGTVSEEPLDNLLAPLKVIAEWNIEGLSDEIGRLQAAPERWEIDSLKSVARNLFLPMVRCTKLEPDRQILKALWYVYTKLRGRRLSIPGAAKKIDTFYAIAVEELGVVFSSVKRRNYPLLMKLAASRYRNFDTIFGEELEHIKNFLHLTDEDILDPEELKPAAEERRTGERETACGGPAEERGEEEEAEGGAEPAVQPAESSEGFRLLAAMFPRAGWECLEEQPDFYAYYQPIFDFPHGFELVPPEDPLMTVYVLTALLQELFYGFRNIDFGFMRDELENPINVKKDIHACLDTWHLFTEDVIGKQYIPLLQEYCRRLEQDLRFRGSDYGRKIESELHWIKRYYFFPYYFFEAEQGSRPIFSEHIPKQYETVSVLKLLLSCVAEEIEDSERDVLDSVKNPRFPFHFDMETITSRRFAAALTKQGRSTENTELIAGTLSILGALDSLMNDPLSPAHGEEGTETPNLFRSEGGKGFVPVYSVEPVDTLRILAEEG